MSLALVLLGCVLLLSHSLVEPLDFSARGGFIPETTERGSGVEALPRRLGSGFSKRMRLDFEVLSIPSSSSRGTRDRSSEELLLC